MNPNRAVFDAEAERPKFEAWYRKKFRCHIMKRCGDHYFHTMHDDAWCGWLAAKQEAYEECQQRVNGIYVEAGKTIVAASKLHKRAHGRA